MADISVHSFQQLGGTKDTEMTQDAELLKLDVSARLQLKPCFRRESGVCVCTLASEQQRLSVLGSSFSAIRWYHQTTASI